jgi:hypothetical protein
VNKVYSLRKYIIEYINREDIDFLKELIKRYHPMSLPSKSGWALRHRWFAYIIDGMDIYVELHGFMIVLHLRELHAYLI